MEPTMFRVNPQSEAVYLWAFDRDELVRGCEQVRNQTDCEAAVDVANATDAPLAHAMLFGPDDRRLGTYALYAGETLRVPVLEGGDYVVVAKGSPVWVGADRVPADFSFITLDTRRAIVPDEPPGSGDRYAQVKTETALSGTAFAASAIIGPPDVSEPMFLPGLTAECHSIGFVRVLADNETLGFWGAAWPDEAMALLDLHVGEHKITTESAGFGGNCGYAAITVQMYVRP